MPDTSLLTLGLELETVKPSSTASAIQSRWNFGQHRDRSILDSTGSISPHGAEFVTPVRQVNVTYSGDGRTMRVDLGENEQMIRDLCATSGEMNHSCGLHIHLGKPGKKDQSISIWEPERVRTMLIIGKMLEAKLMSLVPSSRSNNQHCLPINARYRPEDFEQFYPVGEVHPRKYDNPKRYCWLNIIETRRVGSRREPGYSESTATGTIEVRLLGETDDADYTLAWTKLWLTIAGYVAFVPTSLAIMHCTMGRSLETLFKDVEREFKKHSANDLKPIKKTERAPRQRSAQSDENNFIYRGTQTGRVSSQINVQIPPVEEVQTPVPIEPPETARPTLPEPGTIPAIIRTRRQRRMPSIDVIAGPGPDSTATTSVSITENDSRIYSTTATTGAWVNVSSSMDIGSSGTSGIPGSSAGQSF